MTKRTKKASHLKVVTAEDPSVDIEEQQPRDWKLPSAHYLELEKARLAHWWAKMTGGDTEKTLAAWAKLLHVQRTRKPT